MNCRALLDMCKKKPPLIMAQLFVRNAFQRSTTANCKTDNVLGGHTDISEDQINELSRSAGHVQEGAISDHIC